MAGGFRRCDESRNTDGWHFTCHGNHSRGDIRSEYGINGTQKIIVARRVEYFTTLLVAIESKRDVRSCQGDFTCQIGNGAGFRRVALQEFIARGRIVKQVATCDDGPRRKAAWTRESELAAFDDDARTLNGFAHPRSKFQSRDSGNRWKRLTSESERFEFMEIVGGHEFARRMTFDCHEGIFGTHAAAVVFARNETNAAVFNFDSNNGCSGIERIVQKFFYNGSRAFDDFARGDAVDGVTIEFTYG